MSGPPNKTSWSDNPIARMHRAYQAVLEAETGNLETASGILAGTMPNQPARQAKWQEKFVEPIGAYLQLLGGDAEGALATAPSPRVDDFPNLPAVVLTLAAAHVQLEQFDKADTQLTDHLATARAGTNVELELECLLMLAAAERGRGHPAQARDHLDELTALADRGGYRHILAKAAIIRAELAQTEHRHTDAITAATDAYRLAWCEGPPHTYFWNLKHAEELLHNLDAPIPNAE